MLSTTKIYFDSAHLTVPSPRPTSFDGAYEPGPGLSLAAAMLRLPPKEHAGPTSRGGLYVPGPGLLAAVPPNGRYALPIE